MELLEQTKARISGQNESLREAARQHLDELIMPPWSMGRVMDLALDLVGITGNLKPRFDRRAVVLMAADHGVAEEGVSNFPQKATLQMVMSYLHNQAGCNAMAAVARAEVVVVNMGILPDLPAEAKGRVIELSVARGTANMTKGPAMSREQAIHAVENGIRVAQQLSKDFDLFVTAEMGIGNTTASSAIYASLCECGAAMVTGRGSGITPKKRDHKLQVVEQALRVNQPDRRDGLDVLAKVGGFEIGGLVGLILGAAAERKPILIDGFISTAAALIAQAISPISAQYMIATHGSAESGHKIAMEKLGKEPLLNLNLRLGEGTGASLAVPLVEAASRLLSDVATFDQAGVSRQ